MPCGCSSQKNTSAVATKKHHNKPTPGNNLVGDTYLRMGLFVLLVLIALGAGWYFWKSS